MILAVGGNNELSAFSLTTGAALWTIKWEGRIRCIALSSDAAILVGGGFDKKVTLDLVEGGMQHCHYDCSEFGKAGEPGEVETVHVRSVNLSQDSSRLALGGETSGAGFVAIFDTNTDAKMANFDHTKPTWCVRFAPGGRLLGGGGWLRRDAHPLRRAQVDRPVVQQVY